MEYLLIKASAISKNSYGQYLPELVKELGSIS